MTKPLPAIFLDTEVFDKHARDLSCASLRRLIRLAQSPEIELYLTSVNEQEIRSHLDRDAREAFKSLRNYRRASKLVKRVLPDPDFTSEDEDPYREQVQSEFNDFIDQARIKVISVNKVPPERIFKTYFAGVAPFATGDKKAEFPDAFAIEAIKIWSRHRKAQIFVVSGDKDWKASFKGHSKICVKACIDELLEDLLNEEKVAAIKDFLNSNLDHVRDLIIEEAETLEFTLSDSLWNGELQGCTVDDVEFDEFHVVEAENGIAQVIAYCQLSVNAEISADDSMSAWRDPETKGMNCVWQLGGIVEKEIEAQVTITIRYTDNIPEACHITQIDFNSTNVFIDAVEDDLTRIGEDPNTEHFSDNFEPE